MCFDDERRYHERRACQELDQAYHSSHPKAAEAHFRISALHMQRARALSRAAEAEEDVALTEAA